jgi:phosphatidylglycerol:prolipoprotein diacylglycerol transferase
VVGARLGYALRFISIYLENPLGLVSLNPSTLSLPEGLLAGLLAALIYGQRRELALWSTLDALSPGLAAFSIALALAHLASGDAFGAETTLPWAIQLWGASRHPTQIYETLLALATLWLVLRISPKEYFPGYAFFAWIVLASASQLFVAGFRGDSVVVFGVLRQTQLLSLALLLMAMIGVHLRAKAALLPADS